MCSCCERFVERAAAATIGGPLGAVAQLVERLDGIEEVARSTRVGSTTAGEEDDRSAAAFFLAGFLAGEGCFLRTHRRSKADGALIPRYKLTVAVARRDRALLEQLRDLFGCGRLWDIPSRKDRWAPLVRFEVNRLADLREHVVPLMDRTLLPSAKRQQYDRWAAALAADVEAGRIGRQRSTCSEDGCDLPVRGRGLCRRHYYRATGY